ncbi:hypothetical protein DL546_008671 [Coniochaeta pulveracea]|uniref:Uncharacterized protein n=1 Tax=Coniochaeta pulveracea TaxID=177199 RepID=A0A420YNR5_9PEZI|nr:hypothetical protein DL546_008671 [Coniochaeta pulveracea]
MNMTDASESNSSQPASPAKGTEPAQDSRGSQAKPTNSADESKDKMQTPDNDGEKPPPDELAKAIDAAKAAKRLQDTVNTLKQQAKAVQDPKERERLFRAAYEKEVEAHGQSKKARVLASGWGQGAGAGVGISGAVGMGLGNLVGVLLSGVVAVPGVLTGAAVGAAHGPWYTFGLGGQKKDDTKKQEKTDGEDDADFSDEEMHDAIVKAAGETEEQEKQG